MRIYGVYLYGIFSREIAVYTFIYNVYIQFRPTLYMRHMSYMLYAPVGVLCVCVVCVLCMCMRMRV